MIMMHAITAPCEVRASNMTLRDWLAGQALAGELALPYAKRNTPSVVAERAYKLADAMIAERSKS